MSWPYLALLSTSALLELLLTACSRIGCAYFPLIVTKPGAFSSRRFIMCGAGPIRPLTYRFLITPHQIALRLFPHPNQLDSSGSSVMTRLRHRLLCTISTANLSCLDMTLA